MERRQTVATLLDHWHDYWDTASSNGLASSSSGGTGAPSLAVSHWPPHDQAIIRELHRCLETVRRLGRNHYWAIRTYYDAPTRLVDRKVKVQGPQRKLVETPQRVRERVLPPDLLRYSRCNCGCGRPHIVCEGITEVAGLWDERVQHRIRTKDGHYVEVGATCEIPKKLKEKVQVVYDYEAGELVFRQGTAA